jgi:hypothetical protein
MSSYRTRPPQTSTARRALRAVVAVAAAVLLGFGAGVAASAGAGPLRAQPAAPPAGREPPAQIPAATLRDQFGSATTLASPPGVPVVVLASDRKGSDAAGRWQRVFQDASTGGAVRVLSVADLQGAPRLVRRLIRGQMPKDTTARVLLDWDGALGRPVRGADRPLVAAAYGRDGRLRRWEALPLGDQSAGAAEALAQALVHAAALP